MATELPGTSQSLDGMVPWRLPSTTSADAHQASKILATRSIWEVVAPPVGAAAGAAAAPGRPLTPPDWRIIAAVVAGNDRIALIRIGGEPVYELRIGDKLPGGAVIRDIEADRLIIELNGKRRALKLSAP